MRKHVRWRVEPRASRRALVVAAALLVVPLFPGAASCAESGAQVAIDDGAAVRTYCVPLRDGETITGVELLRRTGLPVVFGGTRGSASVCRIGDRGCTAGECFCSCRDASAESCAFWGYYERDERGAWRFASVGAPTRTVRAGDADGWRWGNHASNANAPRPDGKPCLAPVASTGRHAARGDHDERADHSGHTGLVVGGAAGALLGVAAWRAARRRRDA